MAFQQIPDDVDKYMYLYHPEFPTARRVARWAKDRDPNGRQVKSDERENLERHGWSEKRFACMLYHPDYDELVVRTREEADRLIAEGWSTSPLADNHPHAKDSHRRREQARQAAAQAAPREELPVKRGPGRPPLNREGVA